MYQVFSTDGLASAVQNWTRLPVIERTEGCGREFAARHMQRGQWRMSVGTEFNIIEANDRDVLRNSQTSLINCGHRPNRHQIVRSEHRSDARLSGQEPPHCVATTFNAIIPFLNPLRFASVRIESTQQGFLP